MKEFTFTKNDFIVDWFSGTGPGGQKKNKVQACCRITHKQSGLIAQSTKHRDRPSNQRDAFTRLAHMLIEYYGVNAAPERIINTDTIRTYHAVRNEVKDHASNHTQLFSEATDDLTEMIVKRKEHVGN